MVEQGAGRVALTGDVADEAATFLRLVQPEIPGAYRLAGYLLGDVFEAEDATQDALEKAWQAWPGLRQSGSFGAWFDRIVANLCRDRLRGRGRVRNLELDDELASAPQARDPFRDALARDEMSRLVRKLPPDQQIVVALRYWRDLSIEQTAERLQVPVGTVKSRLYYAIRTLRSELDAQSRETPR
jgi:RNA polymerase sigma-70 factor (ECF subfamily)